MPDVMLLDKNIEKLKLEGVRIVSSKQKSESSVTHDVKSSMQFDEAEFKSEILSNCNKSLDESPKKQKSKKQASSSKLINTNIDEKEHLTTTESDIEDKIKFKEFEVQLNLTTSQTERSRSRSPKITQDDYLRSMYSSENTFRSIKSQLRSSNQNLDSYRSGDKDINLIQLMKAVKKE